MEPLSVLARESPREDRKGSASTGLDPTAPPWGCSRSSLWPPRGRNLLGLLAGGMAMARGRALEGERLVSWPCRPEPGEKEGINLHVKVIYLCFGWHCYCY